MTYIKIAYTMKDKSSGKESHQTIMIYDEKVLTRFSNLATGQATYEKMKADGKKCIFSRGIIFQFFKDKTKEEIKELILPDFEKGLEESKKTGAGIEILDKTIKEI